MFFCWMTLGCTGLGTLCEALPRLEVGQTALQCRDDRLRPIDGVEFYENVAYVALHGGVGDAEGFADLPVTFASNE
jgi:hypothetical protein